ncbi:DUF6843 domain-containing protein [Deinococcus marmoris]|uniref:DUF6843 domain-containing protein n=1 Tax=Deinococcus marmoris TaxID=249408 RepID=UPI00068C7179|nr:hypothetical protein [Deinococcus marmoris]
MRKSVRRFALLGLAPLLLVGCVVFPKRTPDLFLIPQGYSGWVLVEYEVKGAPSLKLLDGYRVFPVSSNGLFKTSSGQPQGWAQDVYKFVDARGKFTDLPQTGWGKGGLVWGGSVSGGEVGVSFAREGKEAITCEIQTSPSLKFFVGTEAQYRRAVEVGGSPPTPDERLTRDNLRCP